MFGRVVLALVKSPIYGIGVALAVLPLTLVGNIALAAFGIMAILLPLLVLIVAFLVQVAIYVQTARYAGSFSGLRPIARQPDFFHAAGKGLILCFIGQIILTLGVMAVTVLFLEYGGGESLWWLDPGQLTGALERVMKQPDQAANIFSFDGFDLEGFLLAIRLTYMMFMAMIAVFIVPLACGVNWGNERTYTLGLVLTRFVIAMPFLAGIAGLLSHLIVLGVNGAIGLTGAEFAVPIFLRFGLELALFAGMMFSFEALLLHSGVAQEHDEEVIRNAVLNSGQEDIRALRQARMDR